MMNIFTVWKKIQMAVILKINVEKKAISITFVFIECVYIVYVDLLATAHKSWR